MANSAALASSILTLVAPGRATDRAAGAPRRATGLALNAAAEATPARKRTVRRMAAASGDDWCFDARRHSPLIVAKTQFLVNRVC